MVDEHEAAGMRDQLVEHLVHGGTVTEGPIVDALRAVPRHRFLPDIPLHEAYADRAIPTRFRDGMPISSASQPTIVACMLRQLQVQPGHAVLEVGAGTGYNAALLRYLVGPSGSVTTVDIEPDIVADAREHLRAAGVPGVRVEHGDGFVGWHDAAPFDRIVVTAASCDLAPAWLDQLTGAGRLVLPLEIRGMQQCVAFANGDGRLVSDSVCECGFITMQGVLTSADHRHVLSTWPGTRVTATEGCPVDPLAVSAALASPGRRVELDVEATARAAAGSLRRWIAFHEPRTVLLSCSGPAESVAASPVPPLFAHELAGGTVNRWTAAVLGERCLAALDRDHTSAAPPDTSVLLAAQAFGDGTGALTRLIELVQSWEAAGRPRAEDVVITAYRRPSSSDGDTADERRVPIPDGAVVEETAHSTFVVTMSR